jgi:hypothetical protein
MEFDSSGDVAHAGFAGLAGGKVAGFLGFAGAGAVGPVSDEGGWLKDLQQESGQGQVKLVRGENPP